MAHFARINEHNIVEQVLVVDDSLEHKGQQFLAEELGLGGRWIQTSYNNRFRKQFAGPGYYYDEVKDIFIAPQPYPSWTLDENNDWKPPVNPPPEYYLDTHYVYWDELQQQWIVQ